MWLCTCDCGGTGTVAGSVLRGGKSQSCGCYRVDCGKVRGAASRRHGEAVPGHETVEYTTWAQMLTRCNNPNADNYPDYGGRGIQVCQRWHTYENFLADMGRRPASVGPGRGGAFSIDRIDNEGHYVPGNCRWATAVQQNNNRRKRQ